MNEAKNIIDCGICGSGNTKFKYLINPDKRIYKCLNCTAEFIFPKPSDLEIKNIYSRDYYASWGMGKINKEDAAKYVKLATFNYHLESLKKLKTGGKLLDVGCATGYFLESARDMGFEPFGVEISEYSADIAKKKFGDQNIFCGTLENSGFSEKYFDLIIMVDLLEHVKEPLKTLSLAKKLLKDDGFIFIITPDIDSLTNKIMGKIWTHYKSEHLYYLNKKSFTILARSAELRVVLFSKAKKALNIEYLDNQFRVYKNAFLNPFISAIKYLLPRKFREKNFFFNMGEALAVLRK